MFTKYTSIRLEKGNNRMQQLEELLAKEKADRIESLDTQLEPINADIDKAFNDLDIERNARVQKEREIIDLLTDESAIVEEAITVEQMGRQERQKKLTTKLENELVRQKNKIENIKTNTMGEFRKDHRDLEKEMDNRFEHQDRLIKNISHFISK